MFIALCLPLTLLMALPQAPDSALLVRDLQSKDAAVRISACNAVQRAPVTDPRVIKAILDTKIEPTPPESVLQSVGYHASNALVACGAAATPVLVKGLRDRQSRARAAGALGAIRPVDQSTLPALRKCLDQNKGDTAGGCDLVIAIGALEDHGKGAVPDLLALLATKRLLSASLGGGTEALFYCNVILAFGMIGPDAASAIPKVLALTEIEKGINAPVIRRHALKSLGKIGLGPPTNAEAPLAPPEDVLAALRRCRSDGDASVVAEAKIASALLDYAATAEERKAGSRHRDPRVRLLTCGLLAAMGREARGARGGLEKVATEDVEESVRKAAVEALKMIGD